METQETQAQLEHKNVSKALDYLKTVLIEGETLDSWAIQVRLYALTRRRMLIAATSGRLIVIKRNLISGFNMVDLRWQDLGAVNLNVGIFGATLNLKKFGSADLASNKSYVSSPSYSGFRKDQIQNIYRYAQNQEQVWREKRRIRELEELRAKSGTFNVGSVPVNQSLGNSSDDSISRLKKAKEMLDNKLITDSEYESIKAKIINQL